MTSRPRPAAILLCALVVLAGCSAPGLQLRSDEPGEPAATTASSAPAFNATETAFAEVAGERGLNYTVSRDGLENGGVYVTDYDGDGWPDVLAVGGDQPVLFENTGGEFERAGVVPEVDSFVKSALVVDADNDGDEDLLLFPLNSTPVYLENTGGDYVRRDAGFEDGLTFPIGATAGDYDGDGCADVFVIQYADWDERMPVTAGPNMGDVNGSVDNGARNVLYRGNCDGGFENVTAQAGIEGTSWSLATSFADFTGDGRPDVHVANDFNNDVLYVNEGDGTFERRVLSHVTNRNAMSSEVTDVNGDGNLDLFVTNVYLPDPFIDHLARFSGRANGNNLLVNRGNGTFVDRAREYGVYRGGWGWAATFTDFDDDGNQDLFHVTQVVSIPPNVAQRLRNKGISVERYQRDHPWLGVPSLWARTGDGFVRLRTESLGFELASGTGMAVLDFDRDGHPDVVEAQVVGDVKLYHNELDTGHAVEIDVAGNESLSPLGARVYVTVDGETQMRVRNAKAGFISQDTRTLHVGLGDAETVDRVRVVWPDGTERVFEDVSAGRLVRVAPDGSVTVVRTLD